jgi:FKBP-type peptidyl-prolyl cis-trans isomerase 2
MAIKKGDTIKVAYTGTKKDGSEFDKSQPDQPLSFTVGSGQVIPGFDEAVLGMEMGEKKTFTIPADKAYGAIEAQLVQQVERERFPMEPKVGSSVAIQTQDGMQLPAKITQVTSTHVTLDFNHPLAGEDLTFAIQIVQ